MPKFASTKTFGHELGLSACFRQWRADSHCRFVHGYALAIKMEFLATHLNSKNWVVDFGSLKPIKQMLENTFDHKLLVAADDPLLAEFKRLEELGGAEVVVVHDTGCEAFAKLIGDQVIYWLSLQPDLDGRVYLSSVEVREHGANSAIYYPLS